MCPGDKNKWQGHSSNVFRSVFLNGILDADGSTTPELKTQGLARQLVSPVD